MERTGGRFPAALIGALYPWCSPGDLISGKISRDELASVVAAVATSPAAANKSFEVRRHEAADGRGVGMGPADMQRLLLGLVEDRHRPRRGLEPLPAPSAPPKPVTDERKKVGSDACWTAFQGSCAYREGTAYSRPSSEPPPTPFPRRRF